MRLSLMSYDGLLIEMRIVGYGKFIVFLIQIMTMALILKEFGFYIIMVKLLKSPLIMISTKH